MNYVHYFPSHEEVKKFLPAAVMQGKEYTALFFLSVFDNYYTFEANRLGSHLWFQSSSPLHSLEELAQEVYDCMNIMQHGQEKQQPLFYSLTGNLGWSDKTRKEFLKLMKQTIAEDEKHEEPWEEDEKKDILGFFRGENSYRSLTAEEGISFAQLYELVSAPEGEMQ